jgi:hypothetical protein
MSYRETEPSGQPGRHVAAWRFELSDRASPVPEDQPRQLPGDLEAGGNDVSEVQDGLRGGHIVSALPVVRDRELVGVRTMENVSEFMRVHSALRANRTRGTALA